MINGKMKSEIRKNLEDKNLLKYIMDEAHRFASRITERPETQTF